MSKTLQTIWHIADSEERPKNGTILTFGGENAHPLRKGYNLCEITDDIDWEAFLSVWGIDKWVSMEELENY